MNTHNYANLPPVLPRQRGFTMVEILVTIIVLTIGLLGLGALQLNALRNNSSAYERSQATMLAYDMIDRILANKALAKAGSYNVALGVAPAGTDCTTAGANCSPIQMAQYDIDAWKCSLGKWESSGVCTGFNATTGITINGTLPEGDGSVVVNGGVVTVSIQWEDKRDRAAGRTVTLSVSSEI